MTKLLVDYASNQAGAKVLAQSDGLQSVSDILASDENRYLLSLCSNKVWFTIRLSDEVFVEKVGIVARELFASTFRHIQILGSRQYPTTEWRVLGEIETNALENQEWFDVSASSLCSKCYVKYLKIRVLTHHALEGYTNCALTRVQVFGSNLMQSLDKIQSLNNTITETVAAKTPTFAKIGIEKLQEWILPPGESVAQPPPQPIVPETTPSQPPTAPSGDNPLVTFLEEMAQLKKQYVSMAGSLYSMNEVLKAHSSQISSDANRRGDLMNGGNQTTGSESMGAGAIVVTFFGKSYNLPRASLGNLELVLVVVVITQIITMVLVLKSRNGRGDPVIQNGINRSTSVVVDFQREESSEIGGGGDDALSHSRILKRGGNYATPLKKRKHGIWKPRIRRSVFYHYMDIPKPQADDIHPSLLADHATPAPIHAKEE